MRFRLWVSVAKWLSKSGRAWGYGGGGGRGVGARGGGGGGGVGPRLGARQLARQRVHLLLQRHDLPPLGLEIRAPERRRLPVQVAVDGRHRVVQVLARDAERQ